MTLATHARQLGADSVREVRRLGHRARAALRLARDEPVVLGTTSKDPIWRRHTATVWRYRSDHRTQRTPLLLFSSLANTATILDLQPGNSVAEAFLRRGFDVYLLDWGVPTGADAGNSLATYCDELLPGAAEAVTAASGASRLSAFGYCLGGVLGLLWAAGHPGGPLANLVTIASPADTTDLAVVRLLQAGRLSPEEVLDETGNVPGDTVMAAFDLVQPTGRLAGQANLLEHLDNDAYVAAHRAITTWSQRHVPIPGGVFCELSRKLLRENQLATGAVDIGGRVVELADVTCSYLSVTGVSDHIVPAAASRPLTALVGSADVDELRCPTGHMGILIGTRAQTRYLPQIADWLTERDD